MHSTNTEWMYGSCDLSRGVTRVSDLGMMIDSQLSMSAQVAAISRSCFFQLHQLRIIRDSLFMDAAKTLVNAFVGSRLDYCNSLLADDNGVLLTKLQSIQNAVARLVTRTRKFDSITPVIRDPCHSRLRFACDIWRVINVF